MLKFSRANLVGDSTEFQDMNGLDSAAPDAPAREPQRHTSFISHPTKLTDLVDSLAQLQRELGEIQQAKAAAREADTELQRARAERDEAFTKAGKAHHDLQQALKDKAQAVLDTKEAQVAQERAERSQYELRVLLDDKSESLEEAQLKVAEILCDAKQAQKEHHEHAKRLSEELEQARAACDHQKQLRRHEGEIAQERLEEQRRVIKALQQAAKKATEEQAEQAHQVPPQKKRSRWWR